MTLQNPVRSFQMNPYEVDKGLSVLSGSIRNTKEGQALVEDMKHLEEEYISRIGGDALTGTLRIPAQQRDSLKLGGAKGLPFADADAEHLYEYATAATVGKEGEGDVFDDTVRRSRELDASSPSCEFDETWTKFLFPGVAEHIRQSLCPNADKIAFRPYKVVLYQQGDFFKHHVDTMSHKLQFGTLAVHLPTTSNMVIANGENEEVTSESEASSDTRSECSQDGHLLLRVGRTITSDFHGPNEHAELNVSHCEQRHRTMTDEAELLLRINMNGRVATEDPLDRSLTVKYAAWLGDVPHEVTPVPSGHRVVLIYRMFKKGHRPLFIPRGLVLDEKIRSVFKHLPLLPNATELANAKKRWGCEVGFDKVASATHIGVVLRHTYPIAGLTPDALKGIDAVAYQTFAFRYVCRLVHAVEIRQDYAASPFRRQLMDENATCGPLAKMVYMTQRDPRAEVNLHREGSYRDYSRHTIIANCVWMQLGFGRLLGGGSSYGNNDCGSDWWYRSAVLVVTNESATWLRRKWLVYAALYGRHGARQKTISDLYAVRDVFEVVLSFA